METYDTIETNQDGIELENIFRSILYLQYDDKKDLIGVVETYKQVYLFHQPPTSTENNIWKILKPNSNQARQIMKPWAIIQDQPQKNYWRITIS